MYQFIFSRVKYPQEAKEKGIQGKVYVGFVIKTDGSVSDVRLLRGIGGGCDEEAMRVVGEMKNWNPALQDGEPIPANYQLPITNKF